MKGNKLESYLIRVIAKEEKGILSLLVLGLLSILEIVYLVLLKFQRSFIRQQRLPVPVISIGNLVAGGTGKTPTVAWLVAFLKQRGFTPAVLTRGYRSRAQEDGLIFTNLELEQLTPEITGDEPYLLAGLLPGTVIAVGRDRYRSGLNALARHPEIDVLIMDDGFQYLKLARDLDILLLDAAAPFGNGHLIPRGTLREPLTGLKRAGLILLTRTGKLEMSAIASLRDYVQKYHSGVPVGLVNEEHSVLIPLGFWRQKVSPIPSSDYLQGKKVAAITGIGNPQQFLASLESLGAEVGYFKSYPDHYQWEEGELENLILTLKDWGFEDLIVTGKDGVKLAVYLEKFIKAGLNCLMLSLEYHVDNPEITQKIIQVLPKKG